MEFSAPVPVIEVRRSSLLRTLQGYNSTYILPVVVAPVVVFGSMFGCIR